MKIFVFAAAILLSLQAVAQQSPIYNHYYLNPYAYNPAAAGASGYGAINVSNRTQWAGSQNRLSVSMLTAEVPVGKNVTLGARFYNDKQALLNTTSAVATFAYGLKLSDDQRLSFALSGGVRSNSINNSDLNVVDADDIAIQNYNRSGIDGNLGIYYKYKQLNIGAAVPSLFGTVNYSGQNERNFKAMLFSAGYRINSDFISMEPQVILRTGKEQYTGFESMLTLYFKDAFWAGGLYRASYGPAFYGGVKISSAFRAGYTYESAPSGAGSAINSSHELLISYRFGGKKPY